MYRARGLNPRKNPYDHRHPANEEVFIGRNSVVSRLMNGLRAGRSYELVGGVGMGKTSVLFAIKKRLMYGPVRSLEPIPIPLYISIDERHMAHVENLLEAILTGFLDALKDQCQLVFPLTEHDALLADMYHGKIEEALQTIFTWYYRQMQRSCRLVILLDDLHRGLGYEALGQTFSVLRPLLSPKDSVIKISLVLSGRLPMVEVLRKDVSTLKGLLSGSVSLAPLLLNDAATIVDLAEDYGWQVERQCSQAVFEMTEGHPFKLHYYLFTAIDRDGVISLPVLKRIHNDSDVQSYLKAVLKQTALTPVPKKLIHLFYSYANPDEEWLKRLGQQLTSLRRNKEVQDWHSGKIKAGEEMDGQILKQLAKADIVLLLISPEFVSSEYLARTQVRLAMERYAAGVTTVIPVLLRRIDWEDEPYGKLQPIPRGGQWIAEQVNTDKALADVAEEIKTAITKLRTSYSEESRLL